MEGDWHRGEGIIYAHRGREGEREKVGMDVVYRGLAIAFIPTSLSSFIIRALEA